MVAIGVVAVAVAALAITRLGGANMLNGLAWMDDGTVIDTDGQIIRFDGDREAIAWLNDHVAGSPIIAEAVVARPTTWSGAYRCGGSRIAIATGLPIVMGRDRHESQQRPAAGFLDREEDIRVPYVSAIKTKNAE